jgi:alkylhydroperoxidase family enzyme
MPTITPIDLESASEASAKLLKAVEEQTKRPLNILRTMAHSPAMLDAYLHFFRAFNEASVSPQIRTLISATVAQAMGGEYMLAAVSAFGAREGLTHTEIMAARHANSEDPKTAAALRFAELTIKEQGHLPSTEVESLLQAGYSDQEVIEIIGMIAIDIWRNLFNLIVQTEVDFPPVKLDEVLHQKRDA